MTGGADGGSGLGQTSFAQLLYLLFAHWPFANEVKASYVSLRCAAGALRGGAVDRIAEEVQEEGPDG